MREILKSWAPIYPLWALLFASWLTSCLSASSNLARLQAECSVAPLAEIGASLVPVPGVGVLAPTIAQLCANPALIASDEAAIAAALQALGK